MYGNKVKVIGVSLDRKASDVEKFISQNNIDFTVLIDKKQKYLKDFGILIIPTLFVIRENGKLENIYVDFDDSTRKGVFKDIAKLIS